MSYIARRYGSAVANGQLIDAYSRLLIQVGVNLQEGQLLTINAFVEHAPVVRAVARAAYEAGARYVDKEVVMDGNIITSRFPDDLPAFCREIIAALEEMKVAPLKGRAR